MTSKNKDFINNLEKFFVDVFDKCHIYLKKLKLMFALIIFIFSSSATGVKFDLEFVHVFTQTKKKLTFKFQLSAWYLFQTHLPF